ncbi:MAG: hypothetical protein KF874_00470 [Rhizobiaceae bacterium]|nr:hypothetical protein [Rhizobiaceae bacterium]
MRFRKVAKAYEYRMNGVLKFVFVAGDVATFIYLTFFDGFTYNWWNWLFVIPINIFLSTIWPIYWAILHWIA